MHGFLDPSLAALAQVILIDLVLAGDNAVVIGLVAAQVPGEKRGRVVFWGMASAVILRIGLALGAASLLEIIGLMFSGGLLLLFVAFRLYRDIREQSGGGDVAEEWLSSRRPMSQRAAIRRAVLRIIVADISMSLDNVLAVAGAAMDHIWVLVIGLLLSIALMGIAASYIAKLLDRHRWISYAGLLIVLYVALRMIWYGGLELFNAAM